MGRRHAPKPGGGVEEVLGRIAHVPPVDRGTNSKAVAAYEVIDLGFRYMRKVMMPLLEARHRNRVAPGRLWNSEKPNLARWNISYALTDCLG